MSETLVELQIQDASTETERWMTVIFDNDHTPFDLVVVTLMAATGCDLQEAYIETWEAQAYGKAPVHFAAHGECRQAANVIEAIGVKTEVVPEWND